MPEAVLTAAERGRMGGRQGAANMTPEQRQARASKAYLTGAINTILRRAGELAEDQREQLRQALA